MGDIQTNPARLAQSTEAITKAVTKAATGSCVEPGTLVPPPTASFPFVSL